MKYRVTLENIEWASYQYAGVFTQPRSRSVTVREAEALARGEGLENGLCAVAVDKLQRATGDFIMSCESSYTPVG